MHTIWLVVRTLIIISQKHSQNCSLQIFKAMKYLSTEMVKSFTATAVVNFLINSVPNF